MEIVNELTIRATIIDRNAEDGALPFGTRDEKDLGCILKEKLGADDLHIESFKQFNVPNEN